MLFVKKTYGDRELETGFYVRAEAPANATIGITPQIFVKTRIKQIEDSKYTLEQIKQAYSKSLGENYTNFTWWSSLWGETTLKAKHPNITQENKTVEKEGKFKIAFDPMWVIIAVIAIGFIGAGYLVLKLYGF